MRRSLLALVLLLQACDPPAPPAKERDGFLQAPIKPPPGILRVARTSASAAELLGRGKPTPGLPSFTFRMDYAGPKTQLEISSQVWRQGEEVGGSGGCGTIRPPVADDAAFGFFESPDGKHVSVIVAHEVILPRSESPSGRVSGGSTTSQVFDLPSLLGRAIRTTEPSWPLEIPDGKEVVIWAMFVDEPDDVPSGATPEERAKRAAAAFLFRIRTADEKK
jgi:hypothetical protein